jgi:hypothetical protein
VRVDELAAELAQWGRDRFEARYGRHFLVLADASELDDVSSFVNTESRDLTDLLEGRRKELDVRPLVPRKQGRAVLVGRDRDCDVVLKHARVSKQHAQLSRDGGLLQVTDLGSKNGTRLNGVRLAPRAPSAVDVGDSLAFGPVTATIWGLDDLFAAMA